MDNMEWCKVCRLFWNRVVNLREQVLEMAVAAGVDKTEMLNCLNEQVEDIL